MYILMTKDYTNPSDDNLSEHLYFYSQVRPFLPIHKNNRSLFELFKTVKQLKDNALNNRINQFYARIRALIRNHQRPALLNAKTVIFFDKNDISYVNGYYKINKIGYRSIEKLDKYTIKKLKYGAFIVNEDNTKALILI